MNLDPKTRQRVRAFVDYAPLVAWLAWYAVTRDLVQATWAIVAGSAAAILVSLVFERKVAPVPLIAGGLGLFFGVLTIAFDDPVFVKIKPTVINLGFAAFMLGGLLIGRNPLKVILTHLARIELPDPVIRTLTLRYGLFCLFIALLNEVVWRTQSDGVWAVFRFPGLTILSLAFWLAHAPWIGRNIVKDPAPSENA